MALKKFDRDGVLVLVVDDDPSTRSLLVRLVGSMGAGVVEAADGAEGLRIAHQRLPTVAVCDYHMAPVGGASFLAGIRASSDAEVSALPVLMFTAETSQDVVEKLQSLGCTKYLIKPFTPSGFADVITEVVAKLPRS
jgi:CheY-like chemotaxis protein